MSKFAAVVGNNHVCPKNEPGPVPHIGGAISEGSPDVLINNKAAARVGDMCICTGPPDKISKGSCTVLINGKEAARVMDNTEHGGILIEGSTNVMIGDGGTVSSTPFPKESMFTQEQSLQILKAKENLKERLKKKKQELQNWDEVAQKNFQTWFGSDKLEHRNLIEERLDKILQEVDNVKFVRADPEEEGVFAHVFPSDTEKKIYLNKAFWDAPAVGENSQMGTIAHEMSHFSDLGETEDHVYGTTGAKQLVELGQIDDALNNADSFEYYLELD